MKNKLNLPLLKAKESWWCYEGKKVSVKCTVAHKIADVALLLKLLSILSTFGICSTILQYKSTLFLTHISTTCMRQYSAKIEETKKF